MNICCPPRGARLTRAAAALLGLQSRRGLIAGGMHVAAQQVASEGGVDATDSDKEDDEQVPANVFLQPAVLRTLPSFLPHSFQTLA
jgi:hypothetical protein